MTHEEQCGADSLDEIYRDELTYGMENVVRWCRECGAIVVDTDVDNRTSAGAVMKMRFPKVRPTNQKEITK